VCVAELRDLSAIAAVFDVAQEAIQRSDQAAAF
jgi:hypothetical protein